jgi:hypothetical protein
MHSPSFPPTVPQSDASLPSPRSGWSRSRASTVLSRRYDFLPPFPPHFVAFAWRYHVGASCFRSHRPRTPRQWTGGLWVRRTPGPSDPVETTGSPKFLGNPDCFYALFFDPGGTAPPGRYRGSSMAPVRGTTRAPTWKLSRLNGKALKLAVYASQGGLPHHHARLTSRCWLGSPGRAWLPAGFQ